MPGHRAGLPGEGPGLTHLPLRPQFLYSPVLLEVLPKQSALTLLAQGLRDHSPDIRVWSLQGLGNILFHPEKVRTHRGPSPGRAWPAESES